MDQLNWHLHRQCSEVKMECSDCRFRFSRRYPHACSEVKRQQITLVQSSLLEERELKIICHELKKFLSMDVQSKDARKALCCSLNKQQLKH